MRPTLPGVGFLLLLAAGITVAGTGGEANVAEHDGAAAADRAGRGADGGHVRIDAEARRRVGLQVLALAGVERPETVRGFGRVLDPTALATPVYDYEAARAAFDAADREYRRVQTLHRGNSNASERDLEAARVAFERERAALGAARARLASTWGGGQAERGDLAALVQSLVAREAAVARIDLPLGSTIAGLPAAGRIVALAQAHASPIDATVLGEAADVDPTLQGRGFLLLVERPPWPPGTAVDGWLTLPGRPRAGVDVPSSAVLRYGGSSYVYVQTGDETFARRGVHLVEPTKDGWFVTDGLAAGESVVITGAQQLLSTELGGAPEED